MKLYKTLLASALCAPLLPAMADAVLLDFNQVLGTQNSARLSDSSYAAQGFHFSSAAFAVLSNKSGNTDQTGTFYTAPPDGSNRGAMTISPAPGDASSIDVAVEHGFSAYFRALVGVSQQSDASVTAFDKDGRQLATSVLSVDDSTGGCDDAMVCHWSTLSLDLTGMAAYKITVTSGRNLAWFDDFEFGALQDTGSGGNDVPEPGGLLLAASALRALLWARRRSVVA